MVLTVHSVTALPALRDPSRTLRLSGLLRMRAGEPDVLVHLAAKGG